MALIYIHDMEQTDILHMRIKPELMLTLDDLRKNEPDLPSRSEMVRRLIERADKRARGKK